MEAEESSEAPEGGKAEKNDEGEAGETAGDGSFAPGLEHGNDSNDKDQDGGNAKNL